MWVEMDHSTGLPLSNEGWTTLNEESLSGGRWATTEDDHHIYIKDGRVVAGNPHVVQKMEKGADKAAQKEANPPPSGSHEDWAEIEPEEPVKETPKTQTVATDRRTTEKHLANKVDDWLTQSGITDPHLRETTKRDFTKVFSKLPPGALNNISETLKGIKFHGDTKSIANAWARGDPQRLAQAHDVAGFYRRSDREMHLEPQRYNNQGHYAHELGHVADVVPISKGGDGMRTYSEGHEWKQAYQKEIAGGGLSKYAKTNHAEGFAEYHRLLFKDPKKAQEKFPECWKVLHKEGIVGNKSLSFNNIPEESINARETPKDDVLQDIYSHPIYAPNALGDIGIGES